MKRLLLILAIAVPLGVIIGFGVWLKDVWSKIKFTPYVKQIDLKGKTWSDLISGLQSLIGLSQQELDIVTLGLGIRNDSNIEIPVRNFRMKLLYKGVEVASTSDELAAQKIVIKKKQTMTISDRITLNLNQVTGQLLAEGIANNSPEIAYRIGVTVFGIRIPSRLISGTFKWKHK